MEKNNKKRLIGGSVTTINNSGTKTTGNHTSVYNPINIPENKNIIQIGRPGVCFWDILERNNIQGAQVYPLDSINCDLKDNLESKTRGESRWYDLDKIKKDIPPYCEILILNENDELDGNSGILNYNFLFEISRKILVCGVGDSRQHSVALRIAQKTRGAIKIENWDLGDNIVSIALITPSRKINFPTPMSYPSISKILPNKLIINAPVGIANDYQHVISKVEQNFKNWKPTLKISIVIPLYNRELMLGRTLAMICHQTYPLSLIEVVVADDGSSDKPLKIIEKFNSKLEVNYVRQKDLGYRLSEVRNLGIRSAKNDYIVLLDCDMAPVTTMIEAYARHLEISTRALYCGHRRYVEANHLKIEDCIKSPKYMLELPDIETKNEKMKRDGHVLDWRLPMYGITDNLRFEKYPFRAVCGGNIGFHRSLFQRVGEFDEDFKAWGKEDTEWGFRVWNKGEYIIPLYEACGLHQEPPGGRNETDREVGLLEVMPTFIDRVPVMYRKNDHGNEHSVPLVSIYIPAYNAENSILETIESVLNQTFEDIEVCIAIDGSKDGTLKIIENNFLDNPRVRWLYQENQGIGGASNTAVQMCRGVYIGQLDSDDILLPNAIEMMLREIQSDTRIGVVYGSFQKETPSGEFLEDGYDWPEYSREKLMYGCIVHHFRLFRARDWWRTDGFATDMDNAIDFDMYLKLSEITEMKHVREWTYVYRIHGESTSIKSSETQIINHHKSIIRALKRRGLAERWRLINNDPDNPRRVSFEEKKDWDRVKDNSSSFARMSNTLKSAAPLLVKELARRESNRKPWTVSEFPNEMIFERLIGVARLEKIDFSEDELMQIANQNKNDLWSAFKLIKNISERDISD